MDQPETELIGPGMFSVLGGRPMLEPLLRDILNGNSPHKFFT